MDELFRLNEEVEACYSRIPRDKLKSSIPCIEMAEYNLALSNFMVAGRKVWSDDELSFEVMKERLKFCAIDEAKMVLKEKGENAYTAFISAPRLVQSALERLEDVLAKADSVGAIFYTDPLYAADREFLQSFNSNQITSFRSLQDYVRGVTSGRR